MNTNHEVKINGQVTTVEEQRRVGVSALYVNGKHIADLRDHGGHIDPIRIVVEPTGWVKPFAVAPVNGRTGKALWQHAIREAVKVS